ncbi:ABC transporter ATP-binding protein [Nocardioides sp. NPDC087217]|uniref:ABC transporter ATP-binding protein n=1 Tax=Nocardioides sp. NPDC087217 TaxID=3364335 RepID=UPI00381AA30E
MNNTLAPKYGSSVSLRGIRKDLGGATVVQDLSLDVEPSEFLTLLGPSGCGKTTTLNMIAGFTVPDAGQVLLGGKDVTREPPNRRDSAMVFQQYALFPHMTVEENVAYGLKMHKEPKSEIRARVAEALERVGLQGRGGRRPLQLSGGQQQRVALARAIVVRPKVLLLDEPLSNLDLKLREHLRLEIKHLQRDLGLTTIFVTHDQTEALVMSDRIAVMQGGRIEQLASPAEIYSAPVSEFVAGFVGQSNLLEATVIDTSGDRCAVKLSSGVALSTRCVAGERPTANARVRVLLRPESLRLLDSRSEVQDPVVEGSVAEVVNEGDVATVDLTLGDGSRLQVSVPDPVSRALPGVGDRVRVAVPDAAGLVLLR